jgi:hypothetical protein
MECGEYLNQYAPWGAKAYVAHVLAKAKYNSVRIHPLNKVFLCIQCHTNFDQWPAEKVLKMKVYPFVLPIALQLLNSLQPCELTKLPGWLQLSIDNESAA